MRERFIDKFEVLLLDMGWTFMFDVDRFDESDDLEGSYRSAGGTKLKGSDVFQIASAIVNEIIDDGRDPANYEKFASVRGYLDSHPVSCKFDDEEKKILEQVIAVHEIGTIPAVYAQTLSDLAKTHRLGLVSDIWSRSESFINELERAGIRSLFEIIVFSSDIGIVKPSAKIFQKAVDAFDVDNSKMVYIGDSLRRDVAGAKNFGMSAIWIQRDGACAAGITVQPDLIVSDLQEILFV
jgi:HAD superfamily hydrolase (TIGR01549 family)